MPAPAALVVCSKQKKGVESESLMVVSTGIDAHDIHAAVGALTVVVRVTKLFPILIYNPGVTKSVFLMR